MRAAISRRLNASARCGRAARGRRPCGRRGPTSRGRPRAARSGSTPALDGTVAERARHYGVVVIERSTEDGMAEDRAEHLHLDVPSWAMPMAGPRRAAAERFGTRARWPWWMLDTVKRREH